MAPTGRSEQRQKVPDVGTFGTSSAALRLESAMMATALADHSPWEIPMEQGQDVFDVVILGGGPAGENVVQRVVRGGLTAAVVESELIGGECSYWACVPSKALLRPVDIVAAARRSPGAAEAVTGQLHAEAALARRDEATSNHDDSGQVRWLAGLPADLVRGHG
ncbi:MAG TPA: FAD-dependent oxidoreductase, partial [Jiangellaceae bacterium]|nr:FAD-dependent oxidoreductase [Jiangellaceae bacterium]